jgi:hypothetical protein
LLPLLRSAAHPPRGDWVGTLLLVGVSEEFMDQYRSAFRCADVRALVDCFHLPLQIVSVTDGQASLSVVADGEEWSGVLERLVSTYQRLGVTEPVPRTLEVLEPMDGVSVVRVQWALRREDGGSVYDFTAVYTLARVGGRLGIVSIEHDELARMRAAIGAP